MIAESNSTKPHLREIGFAFRDGLEQGQKVVRNIASTVG